MSTDVQAEAKRMVVWKRKLWQWIKWSAFTSLISIVLIILGLHLLGARIGVDVQRLIGQPACMPSLLYLWTPDINAVPKIKRGLYVVALMPRTRMNVGAKPGYRIVKKVAAIPGDHIRIDGAELFINGVHEDRLWLAASIDGETVESFTADYVLGPEEYFLMGTLPESFDSRYWGSVKREELIGHAIPLF